MITTSIYASIVINNLTYIERILKVLLNEQWRYIEQQTVLLYEGDLISLSIESSYYGNNFFYMSGKYQGRLSKASEIIKQISQLLKDNNISHSIDYQEEENNTPIDKEFNISFNY
jgi:hypothetical protein